MTAMQHNQTVGILNGLPYLMGPAQFTTTHGPATISHLLGQCHLIYNALLPDGSRTELKRGSPDNPLWRYLACSGKWIYGYVMITADDVVFTVDDNPLPQAWAKGSMPAQLCASAVACDFVQDDIKSDELYGALCSGNWKMTGTAKEFAPSRKRAAEVIAAMRGKCETYSDFVATGTEGFISEDAENLLASMGWEFQGELESAEIRHLKALKLLELCEGRVPREMPIWAQYYYRAFYPNDTHPRARFVNAIFLGKVDTDELDFFWSNYNLDSEDEDEDDQDDE